MRLNWTDMTDYTGMPAPVEGKTKPRPTMFSVVVGPLIVTVSRQQSDFPNAWAFEAAPLYPYTDLTLPAWAEPEQAMERALFRTRLRIESCLMLLPR